MRRSFFFAWKNLFSNCSKTPQRNATIDRYNKGAVREMQKDLPKARMGFRLRGRVRQHSPADSYKNTVPLLMPWQSPEQRTDYQIPPDPPQSSGVSIPQPAPLYPPFHGAGCFCFCKRDHEKSPAVQHCRAFCDTFCYTLVRFARTASILSASSEASAPSASPSTTPPRTSVGKWT